MDQSLNMTNRCPVIQLPHCGRCSELPCSRYDQQDPTRTPEAEPVAPHGGRPGMYLVEELDDREFLTALVLDTCSQLPNPSLPKRK